jgi:hypothetical protein
MAIHMASTEHPSHMTIEHPPEKGMPKDQIPMSNRKSKQDW